MNRWRSWESPAQLLTPFRAQVIAQAGMAAILPCDGRATYIASLFAASWRCARRWRSRIRDHVLRRLDLHIDRERVSALEDWFFSVPRHEKRVACRQTRQRVDV